MKVNITKNEFQIRKDEPNRVFHSYEGNIGDYTFTAETDSKGTDGINKGSIYELDIYNENSSIARYNRKWEYRSKNTKDGAIRSTIIKYIDSISDKKDGEPKKFSKGGNVIERRYVNKEQDYETRYAKDKPMRKGYKDERKFEGGGEMGKKLKGYRVYVFKNDSLGSSQNALKGDSYVLVTDGIKGDSSEVDSDDVYLKLVKRHLFGKDILHAEPVNIDRKNGNQMFGGKFVWGSDSRFRNDVSESPIQLHDRIESYAVGGEIGNQVNFRGDYGKKRSGIITGKKNNGYVVSTDDGNVFVESYEIDSFEEAPIAKKKRFGFFEGGGSIEEYKQAERDYDKYGEYLEDAIEDENEADIKKYKKLMDEAETKMHRYERKYEGGGEIQSKIDKLNKVVNSKMLPESVKTKAKSEIEKLEKELHESKETKSEEKEEHEVGGTESKEKIELRKITQEEWNTKKKHDYASIKDGQKYILTNENGATILVPVEIVKGDKPTSNKKEEFSKSKYKGEKEVSFIKSEKVTEIENGKESENFFKVGESIYGTIVSENSKQYLVKSSNNKDIEYLVNKDAVKLISVKAPTKQKSTKELVGYAIVDPISADIMAFEETIPKLIEASKKLETKKGFEDIEPFVYEVIKKDGKKSLGNKITSVDINLLPIGKEEAKFKVGESVQVKDGLMEMIIDSYSKNRKGEIVYKGHFKSKPSEKFTEKESEIEVYKKPKPDHKKLLAKIKAKKKSAPSNEASLNPKTGERRKRNESSDKKRDALPLGKRISADGNVYYENRLNRADMNKEDKFEGGGGIGTKKTAIKTTSLKHYKELLSKGYKAELVTKEDINKKFEGGGEIGKNSSGWGLKFLNW
jgi:hypothetical protein